MEIKRCNSFTSLSTITKYQLKLLQTAFDVQIILSSLKYYCFFLPPLLSAIINNKVKVFQSPSNLHTNTHQPRSQTAGLVLDTSPETAAVISSDSLMLSPSKAKASRMRQSRGNRNVGPLHVVETGDISVSGMAGNAGRGEDTDGRINSGSLRANHNSRSAETTEQVEVQLQGADQETGS